MRHFVFVAVVLLFSATTGHKAESQDYDVIFGDFDAASLSSSDKRFLQAALAFKGHYRGMLDGDWGKLSRRAFSNYSSAEYGTSAENWHMAFLAKGFYDLYKRDGWEMQYFSYMGLSVLLPKKTLIDEPDTDLFINYRHTNSSLSISLGIHTREEAQSIHDFTISKHQSGKQPYSVRKTNLAVSSVTMADGSVLYTRSNFIDEFWSTIVISAEKHDAVLLNAVSSSITVGRAPYIAITPGGQLEDVIRKTAAVAEEIEAAKRDAQRSPNPNDNKPASKEQSVGTGSGFFVSKSGHLLTNAHVVEACGGIFVDGEPAILVESSEAFDLAILKTQAPADKEVAVFSYRPAKLNSDVTAIGYPYGGLLGGLNVTRGSVSSLKGLNGDATTMQVSAPIQSGNSGGPLLNSDGTVVGVVVAKLDALRIADATGDVPQNVNFAVRGEIAKLFLSQNGIDPELALAESPVSPEIIAENASKFTAFIECR